MTDRTEDPTTCCYACHAELDPEFGSPAEALAHEQWDNALVLRLEGGYGMFIDPIPHDPATDFRTGTVGELDRPRPREGTLQRAGALKVVICHDCAHDLCERVPWLERLIEPQRSHAHSHRRDWTGHTGWDLPHHCPGCGADTIWDEQARRKACPACR